MENNNDLAQSLNAIKNVAGNASWFREAPHRWADASLPLAYAIACVAGVLASVYYRLIRRKPVFTAYSIDVLRSNSQVSSARAREELGFTTRPWQDSIRDHVEWFRAEGTLPTRS